MIKMPFSILKISRLVSSRRLREAAATLKMVVLPPVFVVRKGLLKPCGIRKRVVPKLHWNGLPLLVGYRFYCQRHLHVAQGMMTFPGQTPNCNLFVCAKKM